MKYSKVMLRVFSNSEADKEFQKKFSEALDLADTKGSAQMQSDEGETDKVDISVDKNEDGTFTVTDNINDELTKATVNDSGDTMLEPIEKEACDTTPVGSEVDKVVVKEVSPNEEYSITTKQGTFSVKGSLVKAMQAAKRFSDFVEMDLTAVDGSNIEPEKNVPANIGVKDGKKSGVPSERSFSDKNQAIQRTLDEFEKSGKPYTAEDVAKKCGCKVEDVQEAMKNFSEGEKKYTVEFYKSDGSDGKTITMTGTGKDDIITKAQEKAKSLGNDWQVGPITEFKSDNSSEEKDTTEEALEAAKEHAKEDEDGAVVKTESATVHVKYDKESKKFSYTKVDLINKKFSDIPEDDIVAELDGDNMNPEKEMTGDKGVVDPEKNGTPEAREFESTKDALEAAKERAKQDSEGAIVRTESATVHVKYDKDTKKFSYKKIDLENYTFSDIEEDILDELDKKADRDTKPAEGEKPAEDKKEFTDLEEGVNELEKKAEEVSKEPTEENAQSLKKDAKELEEKVECDKTYSTLKKTVLLSRIKYYSSVADDALKEIEDKKEPEITEEESKSFSALLENDDKVFATKEEIEAATKSFSQAEGAADNPCLTTQF